jgi:integrase
MKRRDGVFKRNGFWWIDYVGADGKRHRKKAAPTYELAKLIHRDTVAAIAKGEVLGVREEGMLLRDFVKDKYWPAIAPTLSPGEQTRARVTLDTHLLPRFGGTALGRIRREDLEAWVAQRLAAVAGATVNKDLARFKHLLNRAVTWGYLKDSPARGVGKAKEAPGRVRSLEPEERDLLLHGREITVTSSDGRTWTARRVAAPDLLAIMTAALQTGGRRGELVALRWADVNLRQRTVTFRQTKNGDERTIPMTDTLYALLVAMPRPLTATARIFAHWQSPGVLTRAFARYVQALGIRDLRFHDLRHDAASTLTMAGATQRTVMTVLGHRDPRMTVRYQHLSQEHVRDAMQALDHPRENAPGIRKTAR